MSVSIEQACCNALKRWLVDKLPDVTISEEWPNPDKPLPPKALTILRIGAREEVHIDPQLVDSEPYMVGTPPAEHPVLRTYRWAVKEIRQPVQLDVWSKYKLVRDDIDARLDEALHAGPAQTLGLAFADDFRDNIILPLADGHPGTVDCQFDGTEILDTPGDVQRDEFRSMRMGVLTAILTIKRQQPRMKVIKLPITNGSVLDVYQNP